MNKKTTENGEQHAEAEAEERSPPPKDTTTCMAPEMQRQMEAARERMKKYHAVYGRPADEPGG